MNLYYIRHGEPDYENDSLTEIGKQQALKTGEYFASINLDKIFSSPNGRALLTAKYTAERQKINKDIKIFNFLSEDNAGKALGVMDRDRQIWTWVFWAVQYQDVFRRNICNTKWYEDKDFDIDIKGYLSQLQDQLDEMLLTINIKHNREDNSYTPLGEVPENVAIFAHGGIGFEIIPLLLGINYPDYVCTHLEHKTCGITQIHIDSKNKSYAKMIKFSQTVY